MIRFPFVAPGLALALVSSFSVAQAPDGWAIVGSFYSPAQPGLGGVHFVDPLAPANVLAVTGLPPEVTGVNAPSGGLVGTDVVLRLPDERIVVSGWGASAGIQHPLFVLTLNGTAVTNTVTYNLGVVTNLNGLAVPQVALLPDGRILVAVDPSNLGSPGEPLFNTRLGIVDPNVPANDPAAIQAVPGVIVPGTARTNGMAFDPATSTAYLGMDTGAIYQVSLPAGGAPVQVATAPDVNSLTVDNLGRLLVGAGSGALFRLEAGVLVPFPQVGTSTNAVRVDPVTGDIFIFNGALSVLSPASPVNGVLTSLTSGPATGWGQVSALDINANLEVVGAPSGGALQLEWDVFPNAGGLPTVGNSAFSVTLSAGVAPAVSALLLSDGVAASPLRILGLDILARVPIIDSFSFASGTSMTVALPIPGAVSLQGTSWALQSIHLSSGGALAASAALEFTVR